MAKKTGRGGVRIPGIGKKIGRPKKKELKRVINIKIKPELDDFIQAQPEGKTELVELALFQLKKQRGA